MLFFYARLQNYLHDISRPTLFFDNVVSLNNLLKNDIELCERAKTDPSIDYKPIMKNKRSPNWDRVMQELVYFLIDAPIQII